MFFDLQYAVDVARLNREVASNRTLSIQSEPRYPGCYKELSGLVVRQIWFKLFPCLSGLANSLLSSRLRRRSARIGRCCKPSRGRPCSPTTSARTRSPNPCPARLMANIPARFAKPLPPARNRKRKTSSPCKHRNWSSRPRGKTQFYLRHRISRFCRGQQISCQNRSRKNR